MNSTSTYPNIKINYMTEENMISLYDYLGKPAGSDLEKLCQQQLKKLTLKLQPEMCQTLNTQVRLCFTQKSF
jgi:hypothetical protein